VSAYSALLVQRRVRAQAAPPAWETFAPCIRIPVVTQLVVETALPGGWQSATFVVPAARSRIALEQYGTREQPNTVWVMDGLSVAFFGLLTKTTLLANGDVQCICDGSYKQLAETRMREVWGDNDLGALTPAPDNAKSGNMTVDGNGDITLTMPKNANWDQGDHCAADYVLFGEIAGPRDNKKLTGWDVSLHFVSSGAFDIALEGRIYGKSAPGSSDFDLLQTFQPGDPSGRIETADTTHGGQNTANWPNLLGYRCFRIGLWASQFTGGTDGVDRDFTLRVSKFNVSTRAIKPSLLLLGTTPTTTDIVRDIWVEAGTTKDIDNFLQEENSATTGGMICGNIADSQMSAEGIAYTDWSTPQEIIEMMTSLDGYRAGMYEPTRNVPSSALVTGGNTTLNYWPRQPPELRYEPWADLGEPDYHIRLSRGAQWEPSSEPDQLEHAVYVNYTSRKGRSQSVYVEDNTTENREYEQGRHTAIDWQISPSVGLQTATTLAQQFIQGLRQPTLAGTLTLYGDRPGSIELPGGARLTKLSTVRPGVIRIVDAKGAKSGRVTQMTYTARSGSAPETLVMTVNSPASARLDRNLARLSHRADTSRNR
jgi:hypothetical protein